MVGPFWHNVLEFLDTWAGVSSPMSFGRQTIKESNLSL